MKNPSFFFAFLNWYSPPILKIVFVTVISHNASWNWLLRWNYARSPFFSVHFIITRKKSYSGLLTLRSLWLFHKDYCKNDVIYVRVTTLLRSLRIENFSVKFHNYMNVTASHIYINFQIVGENVSNSIQRFESPKTKHWLVYG